MPSLPRPMKFLAAALAGEMRAAWVASVWNLNFPSKAGLPPAQQQAEIIRDPGSVEMQRHTNTAGSDLVNR